MTQRLRGEYIRNRIAFGRRSVFVLGVVLAVIVIFTLVSASIVYWYVGDTLLFFGFIVVISAGLIFLILQIWPAVARSMGYMRRFQSGAIGENRIWNLLFQLPKGYTAYANVMLPNGSGDIDFVVVGPGGVYTLEVKHYAGRVEVSDGHLWRGGQSLRYVVTQAMDEARRLSGFMTHTIGTRVYVHSLIVFTNNPGMYHPQKVQSCWVVPEHALLQFISNDTTRLEDRMLSSINNLLAHMVRQGYSNNK